MIKERCEICKGGYVSEFIHTGSIDDNRKKVQAKYHACTFCLKEILDWLFGYIRSGGSKTVGPMTAGELLDYLDKEGDSKAQILHSKEKKPTEMGERVGEAIEYIDRQLSWKGHRGSKQLENVFPIIEQIKKILEDK